MSQQNPNPQQDDDARPRSLNRTKRNADKPWGLACKSIPGKSFVPRDNRWYVWGWYATQAIRDDNLERMGRKYDFYQWAAVETLDPKEIR